MFQPTPIPLRGERSRESRTPAAMLRRADCRCPGPSAPTARRRSGVRLFCGLQRSYCSGHIETIIAKLAIFFCPGRVPPEVQKSENGRADPLPFRTNPDLAYFLLTAFLSSAPGVNFATLRAAILIVAPVCGLRPFRAFLCDTEKVPKPIKATRSPLRREAVMLSTAVSIAVVAAALLISQAPAILSTRSALFMSLSSQVSLRPARTRASKLW